MLLVPATDSLVAYQSIPPDFSLSAQPSQLRFRKRKFLIVDDLAYRQPGLLRNCLVDGDRPPSWAKASFTPSSHGLPPDGSASPQAQGLEGWFGDQNVRRDSRGLRPRRLPFDKRDGHRHAVAVSPQGTVFVVDKRCVDDRNPHGGVAFRSMTSGLMRFGERRVAPRGRVQTCRLCWHPIEWSAQYLEKSEMHVYYRCPHCGAAFPIRHTDATALDGAASSAVN